MHYSPRSSVYWLKRLLCKVQKLGGASKVVRKFLLPAQTGCNLDMLLISTLIWHRNKCKIEWVNLGAKRIALYTITTRNTRCNSNADTSEVCPISEGKCQYACRCLCWSPCCGTWTTRLETRHSCTLKRTEPSKQIVLALEIIYLPLFRCTTASKIIPRTYYFSSTDSPNTQMLRLFLNSAARKQASRADACDVHDPILSSGL